MQLDATLQVRAVEFLEHQLFLEAEIMDNQTWLWGKKSLENTVVAAEKVGICLKRVENEVQKQPTGKVLGPERSEKNLNEKFTAELFDCHVKDDLMAKHAKTTQEATTGQDKSEAEAVFVTKELEEALRNRVIANERLTHSDAALKKCMQQLNLVREEHKKRIHDAVMKTASEFQTAQKELEEKLTEADIRIAKLSVENTHLSEALLVKEKLIEDLQKCKSQTEAEFGPLKARLNSTEKENAFLKYEFRVLEKELEIRNEGLEYSRRSSETSHKQQLECVKKITMLEAECERLHLLMRKRLTGPAALVKMKREVEMLRRDRTEIRTRRMNPTKDLIVSDSTLEDTPDFSSKELSLLIERLSDVEEENRTLKEIMNNKDTELQSSRLMSSRTASRLAQLEAQLNVLSIGQKSMELARCSPTSKQLSLSSVFDKDSEDGISSSGSWANALISELEHFREEKFKHQPKHKVIGVSGMSLMDDFVEMEKLAIISVESPSRDVFNPDLAGKELVPILQYQSSLGDTKQEVQPEDVATSKSFDWLLVVLNAMLEQKHISKRSLDKLLEDIRIALGFVNHPTAHEDDTKATSRHSGESDTLHSFITSKSPSTSPILGSLNEASNIGKLMEETGKQPIQFNLNKSIRKIIKLIEGNLSFSDECSEKHQSSSLVAAPAGYFVRVFQWKISELSAVLQQFVCTCNDLLNGKADLENFVGQLSFALDWVMNNYSSPQNASSTKDKIRKHFGWNESHNDIQVGVVDDSVVQSSCLHSVAVSDDQNVSFQTETNQGYLPEENMILKNELKNMEARVKSTTDKNETLMLQLQKLEQSIESLQAELKTLKDSKKTIEDQIENEKSINEDLDTQLTVAKAKLNQVFKKFSSLEVELEYKNNCCEELETTCLELQLQLESVAKKETPKHGMNQKGKQSQNGWEISADSVKLAECQETILNLGKQLKALASSREAAQFDRVFINTNSLSSIKKLNKRSTLLDHMLTDDDSKSEVPKSPKIKEIVSIDEARKQPFLHSNEAHLGLKNKARINAVGALAIVPSKKRGGISFLGKLILRNKKGSNKSRSLRQS
ncbi:DUF869 domain-containing protein [Cephalotus follicularis]|uniref:DUF869 domain-containing protein n=1 Tax=Cephalotus follicularis TaxID=3775 RepID=A0A1Q3CUA3_CEPFO|nr:DUF869 domain-containing protein [Cephalotus follicularis]